MPSLQNHTGRWQLLYEYLRSVPPGTLISWEDASLVSDTPLKKSRSALTRAREQLNAHDNRTITGQCAEGFRVEVL